MVPPSLVSLGCETVDVAIFYDPPADESKPHWVKGIDGRVSRHVDRVDENTSLVIARNLHTGQSEVVAVRHRVEFYVDRIPHYWYPTLHRVSVYTITKEVHAPLRDETGEYTAFCQLCSANEWLKNRMMNRMLYKMEGIVYIDMQRMTVA